MTIIYLQYVGLVLNQPKFHSNSQGIPYPHYTTTHNNTYNIFLFFMYCYFDFQEKNSE